MRRGVFISLFFILSIFLSALLSAGMEVPLQELTYHAEQYETGNIDYAQLIVYMNSLSGDMAKEMGASGISAGDQLLKAEQLRGALGEPTETTRWAWFEGEEYDKKLDNEAPAWRKIIFDGNKIQIWLSAWPNIKIIDGKESLVYRLHFDTHFKNPENNINIKIRIDDVESIAKEYAELPNLNSFNKLARESVAVEQSFQDYYNQNPAQCNELMSQIFGNENKRQNQKKVVYEINFYEADNFESLLRIEMCDDCEWKWIDMNLRFESRGNFRYPEEKREESRSEKYSSYNFDNFKEETKKILEDMKKEIESGNYQNAMNKMSELRMLNEAWNERSNNVWGAIDAQYKINWEAMSSEEQNKCSQEFCWIKKEQERRVAEKKIKENNYQDRKSFYESLFSGYDKKEYYLEEEQWERRLIEQFMQNGEEICSNNKDDNNNQQIDCAEAQCGGKVCGYGYANMTKDNLTIQERIELYCISGICQAKDEFVQKEAAVCGNHICEDNESLSSCAEDCFICPEHNATECVGNLLFSGKDTNGCPLESICIIQNNTCNIDSDCVDPLCGDASCVEGVCQVKEITECREPDCIEGVERVQNCANGEIGTTSLCLEGIWIDTGLRCEQLSENESIEEEIGDVSNGTIEDIKKNESEAEENEIDNGENESIEEKDIEENGSIEGEIEEEEILSEECIVKSDCGNENDVCSNGRCITLPQLKEGIEEENEEDQLQEEEEVETSEEDEEDQLQEEEEVEESNIVEITGEVIKNIRFTTGRIIGYVISGFEVEGENEGSESSSDTEESNEEESGSNEGSESSSDTEESNEEESGSNEGSGESGENTGTENQENEITEEFDEDEEGDDREREENERREVECKDRCSRECSDRIIRPCTEDCILEKCGNELECNIDEMRVSCESSCKKEKETITCENECSEKCLAGKDTWIEPEQRNNTQEKFVFTVGGGCRKEGSRTDGFIWFGGWGEELRDFHLIKNRYYTDGSRKWCQEELDNLLKERKELEKSLNGEFATWLFEKYLPNSAEDWENHISGIYNIYWKDVDISRQISEKLECLEKENLPEYSLINFKYEKEFGSIEFWEEVKKVKLDKNSKETEVISPYMKLWIFPSRDFFKKQMEKFMENKELPGGEGKSERVLTEEERDRLRADAEFMKNARRFNEKYGESLVIQLKDFETEEVYFNVYLRINESKDLINYQPKFPKENPEGSVIVSLDVNKVLDILEYEESGRIELESPPWDKKPRTTFVKGIIDNVKMYFMFRGLLKSAVSNPENAESDSIYFVRSFFENVMGDGEEREMSEEDKDKIREVEMGDRNEEK